MQRLNDLLKYGRFSIGLKRFLREKVTLEEAREDIRKRLQERESNFLRVAEKGIFGYSKSPYLPLLKRAGCEFGDLRDSVQRRGLEFSLRELREAGVCFTFEQFKGREPVECDGKTYYLTSRDFDNPFLRQSYYGTTGGSTGTAARVAFDLESMTAQASQNLISGAAHGTIGMPRGIWRGILPNSLGVGGLLGGAKVGNVPLRWFTPLLREDRRPSLKYRLANDWIIRLGRFYGEPFPSPEPVRLDEAVVIARWVAQTVKERGSCHMSAFASMSLRIAIAAIDEGIDLTGAVLAGGGEPPTETKANTIRKSGARYRAGYSFSEVGAVGRACVNPIDCNDQHFMKDHLALLQFPRQVPGTDIEVQAFNFTTLLATAKKILLNVEIDDYGTVETRSCGCPMEEYGFTEHIRNIRSFRKLTGEGMSLVGSEMETILYKTLPERYGGSALDYQLVEEEDELGFTKLSIHISPRLKIESEDAVINTILDGLGKESESADGARAMWKQAKTLRVKRSDPIWTTRGKLLPLHLIKLKPNRSKSDDASLGKES